MHEIGFVDDIIAVIKSKLKGHEPAKIKKINIVIGALDHISPEHLEFHFRERAKGTFFEKAELSFRKDKTSPSAKSYVESVEV